MTTLRESLIASGLIQPRDRAVDKIITDMRFDAMRFVVRLNKALDRLQRKDKLVADLPRALAQDRRNPSTSGSLPSEARLRSAAGHDSRGKFKLSGPATKFGETTSKPHPTMKVKGMKVPCTPMGKPCTRHKHEPAK